jgi:ABC-type oligopeptide transport system substrate-binding subunit
MRRLPAAVALLAGAALAVTAGWSAAQSTTGEAKGGVLRVARYDDVDSVDPALASSPWSLALVHSTCARLFNLPDRPGVDGTRVVPEVARAGRCPATGGRTRST